MLSKKRSSSKPWVRIARWLFSLLVLLVVYWLRESHELQQPKFGEPALIYANICSDNLEQLFLREIDSAQKSCFLVSYAINHDRIAQALNKKASEGVKVEVVYDISSKDYVKRTLSNRVEAKAIKVSGLMHQKILVIDGEKVWLGSANMTNDSLRLHDNLVAGIIHADMGKVLKSQLPFFQGQCGEQKIEYLAFPQKGQEGLEKLLGLIQQAQKSIRVAMFTWTHMQLADAIIAAHERGVHIEVLMDRGQAQGVSKKVLWKLIQAGVDVRHNRGLGLLHHKFVWIDNTWLVQGSANWTQAAFSRNCDCFLLLYPLTEAQNLKMEELWKKTKFRSIKPGDQPFDLLDDAA